MPSRPGPRPDQISQEGATVGQVITAGAQVPSFEDNDGGGGGTGSSGVLVQQIIQGEVITTDQAISTQLDFTPLTDESVRLFLNGVLQAQGSEGSYTVSSTDSQTLVWLAGTGTAISTSTIDRWIVVYEV